MVRALILSTFLNVFQFYIIFHFYKNFSNFLNILLNFTKKIFNFGKFFKIFVLIFNKFYKSF